MRRSNKIKTGMSHGCIEIMADAIKAKEQNLSYGKLKALEMMGNVALQEEEYSSEYSVHTQDLVRRTEHTSEKKAVAFVKIR
ncbi:hypothetical protein D6853_09950 [Butyrivibrio sp. X503]|uniref:hypothetical protein n=1 Tax=Butyrivibrio sp. X503 TaxID=2364878 RepID=UPI000EA9EDB8|nr:hypothetical protein [Butyrivibrio sp. X503]RKM55859.1 hypothetical protein D6853_09950 [Butyrivibrio sp. X503]